MKKADAGGMPSISKFFGPFGRVSLVIGCLPPFPAQALKHLWARPARNYGISRFHGATLVSAKIDNAVMEMV
jgi:hypothetical protein